MEAQKVSNGLKSEAIYNVSECAANDRTKCNSFDTIVAAKKQHTENGTYQKRQCRQSPPRHAPEHPEANPIILNIHKVEYG